MKTNSNNDNSSCKIPFRILIKKIFILLMAVIVTAEQIMI